MEGSGRQTVVMMNTDIERTERELQKWRRLKMKSFIFSFYIHRPTQFPNQNLNFNRGVNVKPLLKFVQQR